MTFWIIAAIIIFLCLSFILRTRKWWLGTLLVGLTLVTYLQLGQPYIADFPYKTRAEVVMRGNIHALSLIEQTYKTQQLIHHIKQHPEDGAAWRELAQSLFASQNYQDAAQAYDMARTFFREDMALHEGYVQSLFFFHQGNIPTQYATELETIFKTFPQSLLVQFFLGLHFFQNKQQTKANPYWQDLEARITRLPPSKNHQTLLDMIRFYEQHPEK